jgi:AcrR family transcriptional regulator
MASGERSAPEGANRALNPQRRARVLEAAAQALLQRGFAETRIADIAERAGMSPGHVMYYFDSKEKLLLEALRFREETLFYAEIAGRADGASAWERLERWIERSIPSGPADEQWALWLELWARAVHDPKIAEMLDERDRRWTSALREILDDGLAAGVFHSADAGHFVDRLSALITGWAVPITAGAPGVDRRAAVEDCLDLATAELAGPADESARDRARD